MEAVEDQELTEAVVVARIPGPLVNLSTDESVLGCLFI